VSLASTPLAPSDVEVLKHALISRGLSHDQWHAWLGHPSSQLSHQFFALIIFLILVLRSPQFVMPINWPKVTNYLILVRCIVPRLLWR
jgi:hypothetical protein